MTFVMIRSCNIAIYYRLIIYSNIKDVFCAGKKTVARETMMLASGVKSHLMDKLKDSAADGKTKSCINGSGWVGSRVSCFILGRVGLDRFTCGSDWVGSRKTDPCPTLTW